MKQIKIDKIKDVKKTLEKVFDDWDKYPEGVEIVFTVNTRNRTAATPSATAEMPF